MQHYPVLLLILPLLFIIASAQNCDSEVSLDYSTCLFRLDYADSTCTDFSFINCEWEECVAYYYDSDNNYQCTHYQDFTYNSWSLCT
jgi:hypothetical protein